MNYSSYSHLLAVIHTTYLAIHSMCIYIYIFETTTALLFLTKVIELRLFNTYAALLHVLSLMRIHYINLYLNKFDDDTTGEERSAGKHHLKLKK